MTQKETIKAWLSLLEELIFRYNRPLSSGNDDNRFELDEQGKTQVDIHHSIFTGVESILPNGYLLNGIYDLIILVADKSSDPEWWNVCDYVNIFFSLIVSERLGATDEEVIDLIFHTNFSNHDQEKGPGNPTHQPLSERSVECSLYNYPTHSNSGQSCVSYEKHNESESDVSKKLFYAVQFLLNVQQSVVGSFSFCGRLFRTLMDCKALRLMVQGWCLLETLTVTSSPSQGSEPSRDFPSGGCSQGCAPSAAPSDDDISFLQRLHPGLVSSDFLLCAESWKTVRAFFLTSISPSVRIPVGVSIDAHHNSVFPTRSMMLATSRVESYVEFADQRDFSAELLGYCFPDLERLLCSVLSCRSYLARQEALRFIEDVIFNPQYMATRGLYLSSPALLSAVLGTMSEKCMLSGESTFTIIKAFANKMPVSDPVYEILVRSRSEILRFASQYGTFLTCSGTNKVNSQRIFESIEELRACLEPFPSIR